MNIAPRQSTGPRPYVALSRYLASWWPPVSVPHVAVLALPGHGDPDTSAEWTGGRLWSSQPRRATAGRLTRHILAHYGIIVKVL